MVMPTKENSNGSSSGNTSAAVATRKDHPTVATADTDAASLSSGRSTPSSTPPSPTTSEMDLKKLAVVDVPSSATITAVSINNASSSTDPVRNGSAAGAATTTPTTASVVYSGARGKSLKERSKVPWSFYVTVCAVGGLQYFSGMWRYETIKSWLRSIQQSTTASYGRLAYYRDLCWSIYDGTAVDLSTADYVRAGIVTLLLSCVAYVFFIAPFRAGLWTGQRATKHKLHRYMGLAFMIQYVLAWTEFTTNYDQARYSYMPHVIALNGLLQSYSAFFSFKVLPELNDAGYYSDKAVLSRQFVHENSFFSLMVAFGSVYYREPLRTTLRTSLGGRLLEYIFVFFPYVMIRPFFPITRFSNAGKTQNGRSERYQKFYEIGTLSVKIFFLWAKYFLGFFFNFMTFLDIVTEEQWHFMHGMFLLNLGTVSLAVFLHTLRFRKILPGPFTFSVYLLQIYATFSAVPLILKTFVSHPKLCAVAFSGLIANMTRSRKVHGVWCFATMLLLSQSNIEW